MTPGMKTVIHPVKDLAAAKRLYGALLGVGPYADERYYVGFRVGELEIGLDPNGHAKGMSGPVAYWEVEDIGAVVETLVASGAAVRSEASDVGGGTLIATLADADGNPIGLRQLPSPLP